MGRNQREIADQEEKDKALQDNPEDLRQAEKTAVGGKRENREWDDAAVVALLNVYEKQSKNGEIIWKQIADAVNVTDPGNPRTRKACKRKFVRVRSDIYAEKLKSTDPKKSILLDWFIEKNKRLRPSEGDIESTTGGDSSSNEGAP